MSTTSAGRAKTGGIRGGHVLAAMLAFFAVIIVADTTMIYKALTTFGGVDNPNAYRQGVDYNQRIAHNAQQSLIGWQDEIVAVRAPGTVARNFARPRELTGRRKESHRQDRASGDQSF